MTELSSCRLFTQDPAEAEVDHPRARVNSMYHAWYTRHASHHDTSYYTATIQPRPTDCTTGSHFSFEDIDHLLYRNSDSSSSFLDSLLHRSFPFCPRISAVPNPHADAAHHFFPQIVRQSFPHTLLERFGLLATPRGWRHWINGGIGFGIRCISRTTFRSNSSCLSVRLREWVVVHLVVRVRC